MSINQNAIFGPTNPGLPYLLIGIHLPVTTRTFKIKTNTVDPFGDKTNNMACGSSKPWAASSVFPDNMGLQSCQVSRYSRVTHANQCFHTLTRRWIKISRRSINGIPNVLDMQNSQSGKDYLVPSNLQMCKMIKTDRKLVKPTHSFT